MSAGNDDFSGSRNKLYTFTIENGVVTAYFEMENGVTEQESIDSRDSFNIDGSEITLTKTTSNGTEITVFSEIDSDGFYTIISDSNDSDVNNDELSIGDGDHKVFKFEIVNDQITAVFEFKDGILEPKSIDDDGSETYTLDGTEVIRTEVKSFGTEITRYSDPDGDGFYNRVSEQWQSSSDTSGSGNFILEDNLKYLPSDGNDLIAVRGGEDSHGGLGSDDFVIREAAHLRIADFNSSEDDLLVFDTGLGLTSVEHLSSFVTDIQHDGQNFIVYFGSEVSITLVGVQPDQVSWDDVSVLS